jgi:hypothetical protein
MHIFTTEMFNIAPIFAEDLPKEPRAVNEGAAMVPLPILGVDLDPYLTNVLNAAVFVNPPLEREIQEQVKVDDATKSLVDSKWSSYGI